MRKGRNLRAVESSSASKRAFESSIPGICPMRQHKNARIVSKRNRRSPCVERQMRRWFRDPNHTGTGVRILRSYP
jgi:hypothetical protein